MATLGMAVGGGVLAGWHINEPALTQLTPGLVSMKANAALGIMLAGLALFLLTFKTTRPLARLLGLVLAALGLVSASQDFGGWDLGIDQYLFPEAVPSPYTSAPGRMSPATAVTFVLLGMALLLVKRRSWLARFLGDLMIGAAFINALLVLIGYGYGVTELVYPFPFTAMSLHGAATLLLLSAGMFAASPERGLAAAVVDPGAGGQMTRRLLPGIVIVPIALGWLRHHGEIAGYYQTAVGTALFAVSTMVLLGAFTWFISGTVRRADRERRRAVLELHGQREWLSTTLDSIGDAVIATDGNGAVIVMNRVAEQLSGWDLNSVAGRPIWDVFRVIDEGTRQPVEDPALKALRERTMMRNAHHILLTRDDEEVSVEDNSAPIITADGEVAGAVLIFRDITDRRLAEQRQTMLVGELNHRVKNVLMIVHSLVQASVRHATGKGAETMARSLTERLRSLSRAHELLLETQWSGASLKAMVERELAPYRREGTEHVTIDGPDVLMPPQSTSVLAMTLHELATNAAKYGALSHPEGRLRVEWRLRGRRLSFRWDEKCAKPIAAKKRSGFGMQLIDRGIRQNLGGSTKIDFRPNGLLVEADLPAGQAVVEKRQALAAAGE